MFVMKRIILWCCLIFVIIAVFFGSLLIFKAVFHKERDLTLYGNVDVRQVDISFRVPGQVKELFFEEGDFVKAGTLLTTLDEYPYQDEVLKAKANVEVVQANLANAEILLKRREDLIATGSISEEDLDNALATKNELVAQLFSSKASLLIAEDKLRYTNAYCPTDGIILTRIREPGTVVRETDPIYTLSVISPVWVRAFVDETHLGDIYYGMKAEVTTDTKGLPTYEGTIGFISPIAEFTPKTVETTKLRTDLVYRLRIYINNPDGYLKQGMPVTVKIKRHS